ncbi:hypothetical protein C9427_31665 [Mesorhizobium helmanticense]|uniref:Uncharacterized protein n=1 Tax=Mesorhizobium helmanticense TaxID=1776423 RepID=A0A2T4ILB4_9HYPH|nr:hypothetical protein C9427_31665 [Mesorhizobium helmanticense]
MFANWQEMAWLQVLGRRKEGSFGRAVPALHSSAICPAASAQARLRQSASQGFPMIDIPPSNEFTALLRGPDLHG